MAGSRRVHHGRASTSTRRERAPLHPDSTSHAKETSVPQSNRPLRIVFALAPRQRGGTRWLRVGVAFINRDGSENIYLDAVPLSGKLQIREEKPKDEGGQLPPPPPGPENAE